MTSLIPLSLSLPLSLYFADLLRLLSGSGSSFPAALLELLSFRSSPSPLSLLESLLTHRDLFLSVSNGRDFVAKVEELILNLIQLSKLFAKTNAQLGQQVSLAFSCLPLCSPSLLCYPSPLT
jgi:hypothetical protein